MWFVLLACHAVAKPVTVPVDVGVGPAVHLISGPVLQDRPLHTGLSVSVEAVLDQKTIRRFRKQIPREYREMARSMDEVRISPSPLIPDTLFVSPAVGDATTGMYGVSWRPLGVGLPWITDPVRLTTGAGLRLTYAYLHSTTLPSPTHFLRPGLDVGAELEVPLSDRFLVSLGWDSKLYPPQEVGGSILAWGPPGESIWHIGQAYLKAHVRFPYRVRL